MNHVHQNLPKPQRHVFNFVLFGPKNLNMFDILSQETKKKKTPTHFKRWHQRVFAKLLQINIYFSSH